MIIQERIYRAMKEIGILGVDSYARFKSEGYMDLVVERLSPNCFALTHYYEQNGDLIPDPDMEIVIDEKYEMANAFSFQNSLVFTHVKDNPDGKVNPKKQKELNSFLMTWLRNIKEQGHERGKSNEND